MRGYSRHTQMRDMRELRGVFAEHLDWRGIRYGDLMVTAGAIGSLLVGVPAPAERGDEVVGKGITIKRSG